MLTIPLVHDYLRSALVIIERNCAATYYYRKKGRRGVPDSWEMAQRPPFADLKGTFFFTLETVDEKGETTVNYVRSSLHLSLIHI